MPHTTAPTISTLLIDDSDRQRKDLGDLTSLAESIQSIGLIHPIVITDETNNQGKHTLVAGGRRLATFRALGLPEIPYNFRSVADEADLREAELEENLQRKEMSWQEYVLGIALVHQKRSAKVGFDSSQWGIRQTGQLLGLKSASSISNALKVASALQRNDTEILSADNLTNAWQILVGRAEAETKKRLSEIETIRPQPAIIGLDTLIGAPQPFSFDLAPSETSIPLNGTDNIPQPKFVWDDPNIDITNTIVKSNCLEWLAAHHGCCDHIITDPPYAIDMKNLGTFNDIDRVELEHDVEENLELLPRFFQVAYSSLRDNGYCVTWCDMQNFEKMLSWASKAGFKTQRWPLVWVKAHPCINNAAQYNFTKDIEVALVCRKGNATLIKPQSTSVVTANGAVERKMYRNPFAKPFAVWKFVFDAVAQPGQTILDPFAGEGSCGVATINCGLRPISVELTDQHYPALVENLKKAYQVVTRGKAVFR